MNVSAETIFLGQGSLRSRDHYNSINNNNRLPEIEGRGGEGGGGELHERTHGL